MADQFNLSIRKFLKQVGVTSQAQIEDALRVAGEDAGQTFDLKVVLTSESLGLRHEVIGSISADKADPE